MKAGGFKKLQKVTSPVGGIISYQRQVEETRFSEQLRSKTESPSRQRKARESDFRTVCCRLNQEKKGDGVTSVRALYDHRQQVHLVASIR